jgi:hypothetical protein
VILYSFSVGGITFIASMIVFTFGEILNYPAANLLVDRLTPTGIRGHIMVLIDYPPIAALAWPPFQSSLREYEYCISNQRCLAAVKRLG